MDRSSQTRDETPSRRPKPRRSKTIPKSYSESPTSHTPPKAKKKNAPTKEEEELELYPTKDQAILRERRVRGQVEYLVNWADSASGVAYAPTWEPRKYVEVAGRVQWEEQKRDGLVVNGGSEWVLKDSEHNSQQPAKRKRESLADQSSAQEQGPLKKKLQREGNPNRARTVSQQSSRPEEIEDNSPEDILPQSPGGIQVHIKVPDDFDRDQYIIISSFESSQDRSQRESIPGDTVEDHSQQESIRLENTEDSSQPQSTRFQSQFVIPDSQDQVDSNSYNPTQSSRPLTSAGTQHQSEVVSSLVNGRQFESQLGASGNPESIDSDEEEPPNYIDFAYRETLNDNIPTASTQSPSGSRHRPSSPSQNLPPPDFTNSAISSSHENSNPNSHDLSITYSQLLPIPTQAPSQEPRPSQDAQIPSPSPLDKSIESPLRKSPSSSPDKNNRSGLLNFDVPPSTRLELSSTFTNTSKDISVRDEVVNSAPWPSQSIYPLSASQISQSELHVSDDSQAQPAEQPWLEHTGNAGKAVSPVSQSHSLGLTQPPIGNPPHPLETGQPSFIQFSAPSQAVVNALTSAQNDSLPIPDSILSNSEPVEHILQSIEGCDDDQDDTPYRQVDSYDDLSSANMDDAAARKAARRAARMRESESNTMASLHESDVNWETGLASSVPASIPQASALSLVSQSIPLRDGEKTNAMEELAVEKDVVDEFAVKSGDLMAEDQDFAEATPVRQPSEEDAASPTRRDYSLQQIQPDSENEFFVALPMNAITRDIYVQHIYSSRQDRNDFTDEEVIDMQLVKTIDELFSTLDLLCSHSELIVEEHTTQRMETVHARAVLAENASTKCIFVAELIDCMRYLDKHVAILTRPGQMQEILASVLVYHNLSLQSQSQIEYRFYGNENGSLKVSLIPTGLNEQPPFGPVDLVIAFDSTVNGKEPYLEKLRYIPDTKNLSPIVHPLVAYSIEHIDKVCPKDTEVIERKIKMCLSLSDCIEDVGKLGEDEPSPTELAQLISGWVAQRADPGLWPCPFMPTLEEPNADSTTQADTESNLQSGSRQTSNATPMPGPALPQNLKRQLDGSDDAIDSGTPKRQRLSPYIDAEEGSNGVMQDHGHSQPSLRSQDEEPGSANILKRSPHALEASFFQEELAQLKAQLRKSSNDNAQLRQLNGNLRSQVQDLQSSISEIQPKFQAALNDRGAYEHQATEATAQATKLKQNLDNRNEEVSKLKEQKQALQEELVAARADLASSSNPEIAAIEALREEIRSLKADKGRLEKNKVAAGKELDYMRANYQTASHSAAESRSALNAQQAVLDNLRTQADENRVAIHNIQHASDVQNYTRMIKQLRLENTEMSRELDKKSNELAAAMNGRRSTRGVSAPMLSPGLGGGIQRRVDRIRESDGVGPRSRGTSPANGGADGFSSRTGSNTPSGRFTTASPFGGELPNQPVSGARRAGQIRPTNP